MLPIILIITEPKIPQIVIIIDENDDYYGPYPKGFKKYYITTEKLLSAPKNNIILNHKIT